MHGESSRCTTYVSNMMQGFISIRTKSPNEKFIFMGNKVKVLVEAIETSCLILDTRFHLDLFDTFYIHSISKNLVSFPKLDVVGYFFYFGNGCFGLYK